MVLQEQTANMQNFDVLSGKKQRKIKSFIICALKKTAILYMVHLYLC